MPRMQAEDSDAWRAMLILECERCGQHTTASAATWRCPACGGPLSWRGPERLERSAIRLELPSLWRYAAVLPVSPARAVSLGETLTPLVAGTLDGTPVRYKVDFLLPSGSFKDRGAAVLISYLRSTGVTHAIEDSSGNAAAAIAAYAARAGIACTIFAPARASAGKL
ncbi:MAG: threonine synthase, partial [Chloroflexota bacterium]